MELTHLMFDCETLDTTPNAVVLAIAVVPFTFEENLSYDRLQEKGFFVKFDVETQCKEYRRTISKDTLEWWSKQSKEAREQNIKRSTDDVRLEVGLPRLDNYIASSGYDYKESYVWARGSHFDFPIIESLYSSINKQTPFNSWKIRDTKTFIDVLCGRSDAMYELKQKIESGFLKHHCLCDAAYEAASLVEIYNTLTKDIPF